MYEKHFSFTCKPFELIPNPDFLFPSTTHKKAMTYIDYGIREKIGFILLTGGIGSGKTTVLRNLIKNLNGAVKLSRINNTKVSSEQLVSMINEDFGLDTHGKNKTRLLAELNEFLVEQYSKELQPILLIDEAQNLSSDLLEEIRLLSNLETDRTKLLQIILVGQPELKKTLMQPELKQLRQRINIRYHIVPLTFDETASYIKHRLTIAGNPGAIRLQDDMQGLIYRFSQGIPRLINILCDFSLLSAYAERHKEVTTSTIREVVKDLESGDCWDDESPAPASSANEKIQGSSGLGDIALRLIALEEAVKNNIPEIISLSNKVIHLENYVADTVKILEKSGIAELLGRLRELQKMTNSKNEKDGKGDLRDEERNYDSGKLHHLEDQIESVASIVHCLNERLKSL